eukprot:4057065-Pyramimonas_sp.AAC.1
MRLAAEAGHVVFGACLDDASQARRPPVGPPGVPGLAGFTEHARPILGHRCDCTSRAPSVAAGDVG